MLLYCLTCCLLLSLLPLGNAALLHHSLGEKASKLTGAADSEGESVTISPPPPHPPFAEGAEGPTGQEGGVAQSGEGVGLEVLDAEVDRHEKLMEQSVLEGECGATLSKSFIYVYHS